MTLPIWPIIHWVAQTDPFRDWLASHPQASPSFFDASREADIWFLSADTTPDYVLKRWKQGAWVDAPGNFLLLQRLAALDLPVPLPGGWGHDGEGLQVLAMEYAGEPVDRASRGDLLEFGRTLALIHRAPIDYLEFDLPADASIFLDRLQTRFLDGVEAFADLTAFLHWVRPLVPFLQVTLVHGDYHLGNVACGKGGLSVIDWSEAQLGDWRYDVAWAELLTLIYTGAEARDIYMESYESASRRSLQGLEPYEVIAAIRWLFLCRTAPFPLPDEWKLTAESFLRTRLPAPLRQLLDA